MRPSVSFPCGPAVLALLSVGFAFGADTPAKPRTDLQGDPLPAEAVARMGSSRLRHWGYVRTLAFSPDGKSLLSAGGGGLRIWDVATGKLRRRLPLDADWAVTFAQTAEGIAVAGAPLKTRAVTVQVFDPATGRVIRRTEMPGEAAGANLTFSPDGKRLASTRKDGVWIYDAATGRDAVTVPVAAGRWAREVAFAPDGKRVAISDVSDTVRVHDAADGKELRALQRKGDRVMHARFSPDGRLLVTIPYNDDERPGSCSVWDVAAGKERHRLQGPANHVLVVEFSPDSKYLAMGCQHRELVLWDVASGKEVRRFPTAGFFASIAFAPDGKSLAAASGEGVIRLWDVASGRVLPGSADPAINGVHDLRFSADGRRLIGTAKMPIAWGPRTGREARRFPQVPHTNWFSVPAPDESLLATSDGSDVCLSDARTGKEVRRLKGHEKFIWYVAFLPGGRLASCGTDGTVRVWDVTSGRQLHKLAGGGNRTMRLAGSPDGRYLASASDSRGPSGQYEVILWDLAAGREVKRLLVGRENQAYNVAFSPDGRRLAVAGGGSVRAGPGEVKVWDVPAGREWRTLAGHKEQVYQVAFSPDGRSLASGSFDGGLYLWELASGRRRHQFVGHETSVYSVAFSPDGRLLASASAEAPVYTWDVTGAEAPPRPAPTAAELGRCWEELAGEDAEAAFRAIRRLAGAPAASVPFLRGRLKPVPAVPPERVRRLLAEVDGADFAARRRAAAELEQAADAAAPELRKALEKASSAEVRRALRKALDGLETVTPARLRMIRSVEALEWMGTPEAARLLDELARGVPGAALTAEAAAARGRLKAASRKEAER
jgi:WD40 repeat protein